jgi:transcriptional regulator with XRE-family HTH domain
MTRAERKEFGERLREVRIDRSLSMKQLAARSGVSLTALGRYERGRSVPGLDVALALSKVLDVLVDYLATGEGPQRRSTSQSPRIERIIEAIESLPGEVRESLAALFLGEPEPLGSEGLG